MPDIKKDISRKLFVIIIIVLIVLKLTASFSQMVEINVNAPIDDTHFYETALSIGRGEWLGEYNWYTLAKGMFFSVWLWLLNTLHVPYLIGGQILFLLGICVFLKSLDGYVLTKRYEKLIVFCFLWFMPYSWASFTLRVYRDNIFPYLCLLFFSGFIGIIFRIDRKWTECIPFAVSSGAGLGLAYITREDAMWLIPFAICAPCFCIILGILKKKKTKVINLLMPVFLFVLITGSIILAYCGMNYKYYGVFAVNEITAPEFNRALSVMISCEEDLPHEHKIICKETRKKIAAEVPMMAELCDVLDNGNYYHGYRYENEQELNSNGFFWMFKKAAYDLGKTNSPAESEEYWGKLADEITLAIENGKLSSVKVKGLAAISPYIIPYDSSFFMRTLKELWNSFRVLTVFEQNSSLPPLSMVNEEEGKEWERYLHTLFSSRYAAVGTDNVEYFFPQNAVESIYKVILWIYRLSFLPIIVFSLFATAKYAVISVKLFLRGDTGKESAIAIMLIGLILSFLLRTVLVSYIEVTNFHLGTYLMYLSSAGITLFIYAGLGLAHFLSKITNGSQIKTR